MFSHFSPLSYLRGFFTCQPSPLQDWQMDVLDQEFQKINPDWHVIDQLAGQSKKRIWNWISQIYKKQESKWQPLLEKLNQTFIRLEQEGVIVFDPSFSGNRQEWGTYTTRYQQYFRVAKKVLKLSKGGLTSAKLKQGRFELRCRLVGCCYQLGKENQGLSPLQEPDQELFKRLEELAKNWKSNQDLAVSKELNHIDQSQLRELARYPKWTKRVLENPTYLKEVFSWCLKEDCSVEVLVKCYETRKILKASLLSGYLGYGRNQEVISQENEVLAFRDLPSRIEGQSKRVLTLAIYHGGFQQFEADQQERVNILDPNQEIHFKQGNRRITVKQLFRECARKNETEVDFTVSIWGMIHRHPVYGIRQGNTQTYDSSHIADRDWIHHVPPVAITSHRELKERYGDRVDQHQLFFKVMSSRQFLDGLNAASAHSYLLVYIPMKEGHWKVLSIGFFAYRFQRGNVDRLMLIGYTSPRILCETDQNHCYTMRQRGEAEPIFPKPEEMENFLALLNKKRIGGVFQFSGRNCAHPIQKYAEKCISNLPNFFKMRLTKGKLGVSAFDNLLLAADGKSEAGRLKFVGCLHRTLGSRRVLHVYKEDPTQSNYSIYSYIRKYLVHWNTYWPYHWVVDSLQWIVGYPSSRRFAQANQMKDYSVYEYFQKYGEFIYNPAYLHHQIKTNLIKGIIYWSLTDEKIYQKRRDAVR